MKKIKDAIFSIIMILGFTIIPLGGSLLHIYTTYLLAINKGFWGAFFGLCTPVLSEIYYTINTISQYGFFNFYSNMIFIFLIISYITLVIYYITENN